VPEGDPARPVDAGLQNAAEEPARDDSADHLRYQQDAGTINSQGEIFFRG
jgi:hypothetical protein